MNIDNNTGGSANTNSNEQPIQISQNYIDNSPFWEYNTYGDVFLEKLANRIDKEAKKLELIKPTILTSDQKYDSTGPLVFTTAQAISNNQKWLKRCIAMPKIIKEYLVTNKLIREHDDFTNNEKAVHAMNIKAGNKNGKNPDGKTFSNTAAKKGELGSLYTLFRMIYDYIHTFGQNLQSMYTALCITGENIHGELAHQQQLVIQHTTHLPHQLKETILFEDKPTIDDIVQLKSPVVVEDIKDNDYTIIGDDESDLVVYKNITSKLKSACY